MSKSRYDGSEFGHFSPAFKSRMTAHDKQHNGTPNGRNFATWDHPHFANDQKRYRKRFDSIFPNAPGSWLS